MSTIVSQTSAESVERSSAVIMADAPELALEEIVYPESDGKPMAENTVQYRWLTRIKDGLEARFKHDPQVFVAGDLLWYPVKGQPQICNAPDVLVAIGRPKGDRGSYKQWEENGIAPQVVFEIWSPSNTKEAKAEKFAFYDYFSVEEYYTYDPEAKALAGWLRQDERLEPLAELNEWESPRLGVKFRWVEGEWNLYHPNDEPFQDYEDLYTDRDAERAAKEAERAAKEAAWTKLRELGIDPEKL
ncbi:MAG: Uma2 family endonuclease [Blastocatellia bacterium]